jgi:hypothetical protein
MNIMEKTAATLVRARRTNANSRVQCCSRSQSGQALVELAFMLPILLLLCLGAIEIGRYAYISILVGNAAHAGAAYGARGLNKANDTAGILNAAELDFAGGTATGTNHDNGLDESTLIVSSFDTCGCDTGGTIGSDTTLNCTPSSPPVCSGHWVVTVHVTANGSFKSLFNYPGIPSPLVVSNTAVMRVADTTN